MWRHRMTRTRDLAARLSGATEWLIRTGPIKPFYFILKNIGKIFLVFPIFFYKNKIEVT